MNKFTIAAIVLGLLGLGVGVYHLVETHPNEIAFLHSDGEMARTMWRSYREASNYQVLAILASCGLGLILGVVGYLKNKAAVPAIAVLVNLLVLVIPLATRTHMFD